MSATKGATIKDVANVKYGNQDRKTVNTGGPRISWFFGSKGQSWNAGIMNSEDCF